MTDNPAVDQILKGLREGQVPRQVRVFAAQGLLPVGREELLRMQILLTSDAEEEIAGLAKKSVKEEDAGFVLEFVARSATDPLELELLARVRREEDIWMGIAGNQYVADQTLRVLARHGGPLVQDVIITNQVRLLSCLELLEDLRANPTVGQVVLRRVKEFEEEFIEKAIRAEERGEELDAGEVGPSIEEALEELKAIGARIPALDELLLPVDPDEELAKEARRSGKNAFAALLTLNTHEKIMRALKGNREERSILITSRNRLVARAVLGSPKLSDLEVERFAASKSVSDEVIRTIAANPRWLRRYPVILALAGNPKTPLRTALNLLARLNVRDLKRLSRDRSIPGPVRSTADRLASNRR